MIAINDDPLILETQDVISSYYENTNTSKLSPGANSLKNTSHLKALSTALQMAGSHHGLGVEVVAAKEKTTTSEEDSDQFKAAINHHLHALILTRETQRLREASHVASNISSMGGTRKSITAFFGDAMNVITGGRRLTTVGRDLNVVS